MAVPSLRSLRLKLTAWYLATLCTIIVVLGLSLFLAITRQFDRQLGGSLRIAAGQLEIAARTRDLEASAQGRVVDAVEELRIPDRILYLLDTAGVPDTPHTADEWIRAAARRASTGTPVDLTHHVRDDSLLQLHAERFALADGRSLVAVAVADKVELEDRYAALIVLFSTAAALALVLVAGGGWFLVRQATAPIELSMQRMRQFMADAAHELRTPITVLRAQADVALQRDRDPAAYVAALRGIESESRRLGRIVDDLLTLARADSGQRAIVRERVFLDDVVADVVESAGAMAVARGIRLTLSGFEEAPVAGDAELLRQLAMILIDNAIKFTGAGGQVDVVVGLEEKAPFVRVVDNGPGIASDQLPHIFERFYRGDPARRRADADAVAGGAGLGLAIAQWIATEHQATITVQSEPHRGTTMVIRFPVPLPVPVVSSS